MVSVFISKPELEYECTIYFLYHTLIESTYIESTIEHIKLVKLNFYITKFKGILEKFNLLKIYL